MENLDIEDIQHFYDTFVRNECLDHQITNTTCLKLLYLLLNLKSKKIVKKQSEKILFPVYKIYEQDSDNLFLQCEVLKIALSVIKNEYQEIENIITYLNNLVNDTVNLSMSANLKVVHILNEILSCSIKTKDILKKSTPVYIHKFLIDNMAHKDSPIRTYILSNILSNYLQLLNKASQLDLVNTVFLNCKFNNNLDVLCIIFTYINIPSMLIQDHSSILYREEFWIYLGNSISSLDNSCIQKQATFLLEKIVNVYYDTPFILSDNISFIKISNMSVEESKKIWQIFFVLLDSLKEKQLHVIEPSLKLLNSIKHLNALWQISIYKILLSHSQHSITSFTIYYIFQEKVVFPELFYYILSAINKNGSSNSSTFENVPSFCNSLEDNFHIFLNDLSKITLAPVTMWYLFNNLFCSKLEKNIPLKFFEPIYKQILQIPHIYIRNGCAEVFITNFLKNYNWKDSPDHIFKMLVVLRDYNKDLFVNVVLNHVDLQFINELKPFEWITNEKHLRLFEVFVQIIKLLKVQDMLKIFVENTNIETELLIIIYANNFDFFSKTDMEKITERTDNLSQTALDNVLIILTNLMKYHDVNQKMYEKVKNILSEPKNYNRNLVYIMLDIAVHFFTTHDVIKIIANKWKDDFINCYKFDESILVVFCELYFLTSKNCDTLFLENICNSQSDFVISKVFEKYFTIVIPKNPSNCIEFLKIGIKVLPSLSKSKYFNMSIKNYINCLCAINWSTFDETNLDLLRYSINTLLQLTDTNPSVYYCITTNIKKNINQFDCNNSCSNILIPIIVELLLKCIIMKQDERAEYNVCQDIYKKLGNGEDSPNMKKLISRLCCLDSILQLIAKRTECADDITSCLIEKYKIHFNKRYFPDSQIHLQKLRIMQALLIIYPFIGSQRQILIDLILESFCTEIHQPCVKQLMQWLLFSLLKDEDNSISLLADKIKSTTKTQPSTVAAFILVLLHITFTKLEPFWSCAVEVLLPWCMGPHFKLRVYSQMAIKTLQEEARKRSYQNFLSKYGFLEKSVNFIVEASGQAFQDTLKTDELFFNNFNPKRDYSLQTILIDIPKLNAVAESEWQNILLYNFANHEHIPITNEDKTFAYSITNNRHIEKNKDFFCGDTSEVNFNIQRKITPWKMSMEEPQNKELGDFILIASLIDKPTNLGGLSRTCEVFGVKQLVLNDAKMTKDKDFKGLSMTSENWVDCVEVKVPDLKKFIFELRKKGYCLVGAEQTSESVSLNNYKFNKRTALLLGNEKAGIPPDLIPILDTCVEIPQLGLIRSLNVHVAGATFIWEYAKQHLIS